MRVKLLPYPLYLHCTKIFCNKPGKIQPHSSFVFEVTSPQHFKHKQCSDNRNFVAFPIKVYKISCSAVFSSSAQAVCVSVCARVVLGTELRPSCTPSAASSVLRSPAVPVFCLFVLFYWNKLNLQAGSL